MTCRIKVTYQEKHDSPEGTEEKLQEMNERKVEEFRTLRKTAKKYGLSGLAG